jgi:hypothetical protein
VDATFQAALVRLCSGDDAPARKRQLTFFNRMAIY